MSKRQQLAPVRLAMREEANFWNAYIAKQDTMEGAILIGSIVMKAVRDDPVRKEIFMTLMQSFMAEMLTSAGFQLTDFITRDAPEHERAGNA